MSCQRYIEFNPVRANMVNDPSEYKWSSYRANALGLDVKLCTPHQVYLNLGQSDQERLSADRSLFDAHADEKLLDEISVTVNKGMALGNERFKDEIEQLSGRRVTP